MLCPVINAPQLRLRLHLITIAAQLLLDVRQLIRADNKGIVSEELHNEL